MRLGRLYANRIAGMIFHIAGQLLIRYGIFKGCTTGPEIMGRTEQWTTTILPEIQAPAIISAVIQLRPDLADDAATGRGATPQETNQQNKTTRQRGQEP